MRTLLVLVVIGLGACGGNDPMDVVGEWQAPINGFNCADIVTFSANDTFGLGRICELQSGTFGIEIHRGTYGTSGSTVSLTQTRSSCQGDVSRALVKHFVRTPDTLTLSDDIDIVVYTPVPNVMPSGARAQTGCFDASLNFDPTPEHDVF